MASDKVTRRLAAIFAADMVGYSRLIEADEEGTIARHNAHRSELIDPKLAEHNGRIVKTTGDGMLVEFSSVVDAVRCAVEVQQAMEEREAAVPDENRIRYRVGVNLGDIVIEGDDVMGDGVNVAARLEALAKPGEVLISGTAFDQLKKKLQYGYRFQGERKVKNIAEPVRTYVVLPDTEAGTVLGRQRISPKALQWISVAAAVLLLVLAGMAWWRPWSQRVEAASLHRMAFPLPKRPSIAVLPFDNLSGDGKQDFLGDSIARNIIGSLSKISQILVIARKSASAYKGKDSHRAAEALGVRYVLRGSVQKAAERIRVTVQLIDAVKGQYLWSERYDRRMVDLFTVFDDITREIVIALHVKFTEGEHARVRHRHTNNLRAWEFAAIGYAHFEHFTKADMARARELFTRAVNLDPNYTWAWAKIGLTHLNDANFGFSKDPAVSFEKAVKVSDKAFAQDDSIADVHFLRALIRLRQRKYEQALAAARKAVALDPNYPQAHAALAIVASSLGQWDETISSAKLAMRLHPHHPSWYFFRIGRAYVFKGQYDLAVAISEKALGRAESDSLRSLFHMTLAFAHSEAGRPDVARKHVLTALKLNPRVAQEFRNLSNFKNPAHLERMLAALKKAGLPE